MKITGIAFIGIPVTDMKRARDFYEGVLGLKVSGEIWRRCWIEYSNWPERWLSQAWAINGSHQMTEPASPSKSKTLTQP